MWVHIYFWSTNLLSKLHLHDDFQLQVDNLKIRRTFNYSMRSQKQAVTAETISQCCCSFFFGRFVSEDRRRRISGWDVSPMSCYVVACEVVTGSLVFFLPHGSISQLVLWLGEPCWGCGSLCMEMSFSWCISGNKIWIFVETVCCIFLYNSQKTINYEKELYYTTL